ncbi:MAG: hypothetical protein LBB22_06700 [Treponema sp.]|jgi:hypothetical protein|nr:hypothetical protein [Treponema sp.]
MNNNQMKYIYIFFAAIFAVTGCEKGNLPALIADTVEGVLLPQYFPPVSNDYASSILQSRYSEYGTIGSRINQEDLSIKYVYTTSDDVMHIVLRGKVYNGIPEGLLWNESLAGTFGVPSGTYGGIGDFKIGTLAATGSQAIGSLYFDTEWMSAGFYTVAVISGIVDDSNQNFKMIRETNESLRLFSKKEYRDKHYPDHKTFFDDSNGKMLREYTYDKPNEFPMWDNGSGEIRGGYYILISKKADPQTAFLEIEYKDGTTKKVEIDYSEVELREEEPLIAVEFQSPTPSSAYPLTVYSASEYSVDVVISEITAFNKQPIKPLYLMPIYDPVDIDPRKTTTNMISEISLTYSPMYSPYDPTMLVPNPAQSVDDPNIILEWDDTYQAITLYFKETPVPDFPYTPVYINASLRIPIEESPLNPALLGISCTVNFQ